MSESPKNPHDINDDSLLSTILSQDAELCGVAEQFVRTLPQRVQAMDDALRLGAYERLRNVAHHLKASGAYLGYRNISESAAQIEQAAHDYAIDGLAQKIDELTALIAAIQENIKRD